MQELRESAACNGSVCGRVFSRKNELSIQLAGISGTLFCVSFRILAVDHVQIAAPKGCEPAARKFYGEILGMMEIAKPAELRTRGGCGFQCGTQQLHIGVEDDFRPAKKAHPAFNVENLDTLRESLLAAGIQVVNDDAIPGVSRFYVADPFGNRLEFQSA